MYRLEYLKLAKEDMDNIIYYISYHLKNKTAALHLAEEFIKSTNNIMLFPYGTSEYVSTWKLKNKYRRVKVKNFYIFYTIDEKKKVITIARVVYRKRDLDKLLK